MANITYLTNEQLEANRDRFLHLVDTLKRDGIDKLGLKKHLLESDFFYAPASAKYHAAFKGGLCYHCLNVYDTLRSLIKIQYPDKVEVDENGDIKYTSTSPYIDDDSLIIVALFHDFSKTNYYATAVFNKKIYSANGSKSDEMGKFDWKSFPGFTVKDSSDRFLFGTHGQNSEYMTGTYIPLTMDESVAIINHHSNYDNPQLDVTSIYNRFSLACLLHLADMYSTYIIEKI